VKTGGESGSLTAFLAVLSMALFALIGLVVDAGRAVAERSLLMVQAQQAARLGADQISVPTLRSGIVQLDPGLAIAQADGYLRWVGLEGSAAVVGQNVIVQVHSDESTVILGLFGVKQINLSVTARATFVHGVTQAD
jgi:hypothetical protein